MLWTLVGRAMIQLQLDAGAAALKQDVKPKVLAGS